jgi:hypothetical protein
MTDRELLELAAKAADCPGLGVWDEKLGCLWDGEGWTFDPLNDDGDALRLAVKLELDITFMNCDTLVLNVCEGGGDPFAQTRRAITRAAAELGRSA